MLADQVILAVLHRVRVGTVFVARLCRLSISLMSLTMCGLYTVLQYSTQLLPNESGGNSGGGCFPGSIVGGFLSAAKYSCCLETTNSADPCL